MNTTKIATLRTKIRNMGYALAQAEMRGLGGKGLFSQKLAHNLLLSELYLLEKRVQLTWDPQLSWLERPTHNRRVLGSSPSGSTKLT